MKLIIAAVHLITESSDHYNDCLQGISPEDIVKQLEDRMGEELSYVGQIWVDTLSDDHETSSKITELLQAKSRYY